MVEHWLLALLDSSSRMPVPDGEPEEDDQGEPKEDTPFRDLAILARLEGCWSALRLLGLSHEVATTDLDEERCTLSQT